MNEPSQTNASPSDGTIPSASDHGAVLDQQIQHMLVAVEHELRRHPEGMNELSLIKRLQSPPWELIGEVSFSEPEKLYPVHFLLFHTLYRLRDQLNDNGETLNISPMRLQLQTSPVVSGSGFAGEVDTLREFYLDISQYRMSEDSIQKMMNDFWTGHYPKRPQRHEAIEAAELLGFDHLPDSFSKVKHRFRRAVMQAHPDRGGDTESIQSLNQAFSVLKAHFQ
ncbi:DNA-J related domain-containing protein [uncultured Marinobacter sp.]|uniref:DNA-J related domain-containing protein n=1 Tax=uncultured Marinobacter sp. TaxID=187379 RepID=UPI0026367873|nr:DNA-J related domain-containing protein [uncultured Marinobacter sp.]